MSIKDWPVNERPREKLLANGAHSLSDAGLLAVLLGDSASVHSREVVKQALSRNAAAVILAHNQPLCCVAGVITGSGVTGSGSGGQLCARNSR